MSDPPVLDAELCADVHVRARARFDAAFSESGDAILADSDGVVLAIFGPVASAIAVVGDRLPRFRGGASSDDFADAVRAVLGAELLSRVARVELADGTVGTARLLAVRSDDAERTYLVVVFTIQIDANELVHLRQTEHVYSLWFERAPTGVCLVATDGRFLRANPAFCRHVGRSQAELLDLTFQDITHPDDLDLDVALVGQVLDGTIDRYDIDKRYLTPDGAVVWAHLTVALVRDSSGHATHFISMIDDITERRKTQRQLTASLELHRALFEHAPVAMAELALDGTILRVNTAAGELVGVSPHQLLGLRVVDLGEPGERDATTLSLFKLAAGDIDVTHSERTLLDVHGRLRHLLAQTAPLRNADQQIDRLIMQAVDVTEARELRDQLEASIEKLSVAYRERVALMTAVTHDLRAPLATIRILAELLRDANAQQRSEICERLIAEAVATELVLSDLAAAEPAAIEHIRPRRVSVALNDIIERAVRLQRSPHHPFSVSLTPDRSDVIADPDLLDRIATNLIANALRHTPDGTTVWISTTIDDQSAELVIEDDGPGVADELKESIFQPYVRGPDAGRPGSGIGLYLVRQFAEFHGGVVSCTDRNGGGARFTLQLPRK